MNRKTKIIILTSTFIFAILIVNFLKNWQFLVEESNFKSQISELNKSCLQKINPAQPVTTNQNASINNNNSDQALNDATFCSDLLKKYNDNGKKCFKEDDDCFSDCLPRTLNNYHIDGDFLTVKNGIIYHYFGYSKIKSTVGYLSENKINIFIDNNVISFIGDLKKLQGANWQGMLNDIVFYDDLMIGKDYHSPYGNPENLKIKFNCSRPLSTDLASIYDCKTDNKSFVSYYTFSDADIDAKATGGETTLSWKKIYIKNIKGTNYIIEGRIGDKRVDTAFNTDDKEKIKQISSRNRLDSIVTNNKELIQRWDNFVNSL